MSESDQPSRAIDISAASSDGGSGCSVIPESGMEPSLWGGVSPMKAIREHLGRAGSLCKGPVAGGWIEEEYGSRRGWRGEGQAS